MLNLIEYYNRLDSITRCNCLPRIKVNTVKAHTAGVAFACLIIADYEERQGASVNLEDLLTGAVVHDMEEVFTGDVPYPFKNIKGVRKKLKEAISDKMEGLLSNYLSLYLKWENAKSNDIEGRILAYADMLDLMIYCKQEIELGNNYMFPVIEEAMNVSSTLNLSFDTSADMMTFKDNIDQLKINRMKTHDFERGIK